MSPIQPVQNVTPQSVCTPAKREGEGQQVTGPVSLAERSPGPQLAAFAMMVENSFAASAADMAGVLQ
jgi:hypothetical protein